MIKNNLKTVFVALAFVTLLPIMPVQAATSYAGQVIKGSGPQVFYVTKDSQRLVFVDEATYRSWYQDFSNVISLPDWQINQMPLIGTVAIKPGTHLVKAIGDNHIYAIARYGVARWISTPSTATLIYGKQWQSRIVNVLPTTLASYVHGGDVTGPDQFWWSKEESAVQTIDDNFLPTFNTHAVLASASNGDSATLTLNAIIHNGFDGRFNATPSNASLFIQSTPVRSGAATKVAPGDYTVYQVDIPGFITGSWGGDCLAGGTVGLQAGDHKTCTITYDYSPAAAQEPVLVASVKVINAYDGKLLPDDFGLLVGSTFVQSGSTHSYAPGWVTLRVSNRLNYIPLGWSGDCSGDGTIELKRGHAYSCTYTFQDVQANAFHPTQGDLVLNAQVQNPHGGTLKPSDIKFFIEGKQVASSQLNVVDPRDYTVYRVDPAGYSTTGWQGNCNSLGQVHVDVLSIKTCTVVYVQN